MSLIAALNQLQEQHGYLSPQVLRDLSVERNVPLYAIQAVVSFYPHFRTRPPAASRIGVCRDMACHLAGADELYARLQDAAGDADVDIQRVSCPGRCDSAPMALVDDVPIGGRDERRLRDLIGNPIGSVTWHAPTKRRWELDPYDSEAEHYGLLRRLRAGDPLDVIGTLKAGGLRGMGGAAFPTGRKWELVADQAEPVKYVICNADESEPGTFKDRVILGELPHLVFDGLLAAVHTVRATKAYIFIRHEYEPERRVLQAELDRICAAGLLDGLCEVEIFVSPGGYILGEETALLECLEDKRGEPRNKPPFPGAVGLHGKPTLINNVETFAAAAAILQRGADWWQAAGANGCTGYKFISVSGNVARPDVYLIPMGTTVADLIELAGGVTDGKALKAFAPGGASSNFLSADKADTPIDFDQLQRAGSMLGSGALFVVAEGTDMMALGTNVVRFFRNESCGKCVPCRVGSEEAVTLLERLLKEGGRREELDLLDELADTLEQTSICGLGQVALNPIRSVIRHLPDDVTRHVK